MPLSMGLPLHYRLQATLASPAAIPAKPPACSGISCQRFHSVLHTVPQQLRFGARSQCAAAHPALRSLEEGGSQPVAWRRYGACHASSSVHEGLLPRTARLLLFR